MKRKQGISLIVLVITIIVMIILAASVVITLSNVGIIGKASDAITTTDLKNIQQEAEVVKLLEFGNNITMNGHQARMNKNILIQKLLEHFKGSTQQGDRIITADGKYAIIVTDDLTIIVIPNEKAKKGDLLVNISYDNSSKQVPVKVYVTPTIYGWEGETNEGYKYSTYQEYAEAVLANVKTDEELEQIFVDGQNDWNEANDWGYPVFNNIDELVAHMSANYDNNAYNTVEGMVEYYGFESLRDMAIAMEFVKPAGYYGETYRAYAKRVLEGVKTDEELEQIFVDGQNYWNEANGLAEPMFDNIDELVAHMSAKYDNNAYNTVEGMVEYNGFESLRDMAIAMECVKPAGYYGESYRAYAKRVLEGVKTDEELEQIFVDGQNYWNEVNGGGEPNYKDINELMEYWGIHFCDGTPITSVEQLCEEYGYVNLREFAIAWQYVKPDTYNMPEGGVVIKCSNGEILRLITGETAVFTINYPGEITFEVIKYDLEKTTKKIQIEATMPTFTLVGGWALPEEYEDKVLGTFEYIPGMTWEEWLETPLAKGVFSYRINYDNKYLKGFVAINLLEVEGIIDDEDGYVIYSDLIESKEYYLVQYE